MPRVLGYFDDVRSVGATVSIPAATPDALLRYELVFEEEGVEIGGTMPLDLREMRLTVDLPIIVHYHQATRAVTRLASVDYDESDVRVHFSFEPELAGVAEWFPGFFPRWRRLIQRTVETACGELFAAFELRQLFSDLLHADVLEQIGEQARPVGVAPAHGKLRIAYYDV
jgi:hypothetical protein